MLQTEMPDLVLLAFLEEWVPQHPDSKNFSAALESFSTTVTKDGRPRALGIPSGSATQLPELTGAQADSHLRPQIIGGDMDPKIEAFYQVGFFTDKPTCGFIEALSIFFSPRYAVSFITMNFLKGLQQEPIFASVRKVFNPRGGQFQPVGITSLFLSFAGRDVGWVNFLVLDVEPTVLGALAIIGKPDIDRIVGTGWTPDQTTWLRRSTTPAEVVGPQSATSPRSETSPDDTSSLATETSLDERKERMLDEIIISVAKRIKLEFAIARGEQSASPYPSTSTEQSNTPDRRGHSSQSPGDSRKKRKVSNTGGLDDEDDISNDEGADRGKRRTGKKPLDNDDSNPDSGFACPYFKYNPAMYKKAQNCPGPGWPSVHRVKEHLYRRHRQPKYRCGRCWQPFKDERSHLEHQRLTDPCALRDIEHVEGFDAGQERSLRSRRRVNPERSEVAKWREVFKILFPHVEDEDIPTPFYDYGELAATKDKARPSNVDRLNECEEYVLRVVPPRLRQALGRELEADLIVVEESLRRKAAPCVKTLIADAFREFRQSLTANNPTDSVSRPESASELQTGIFPQDDWLQGFNLDFTNPFDMLGNEELGYDQQGYLFDGLLYPTDEDPQAREKQVPDSGYGSNSLDESL
ncbi:hypothetical protein QBC47DRAFT_372993 [Echria macrotheca]|uniref:C2H2-type domain-containing protein n=1 Tax=Echria macrotheca TaxID=438768 RepID=A0AAJ0BM58_9PEZI|nr:hypothetical protein QBC47DRAFT_372993 [Echria macrotheca]